MLHAMQLCTLCKCPRYYNNDAPCDNSLICNARRDLWPKVAEMLKNDATPQEVDEEGRSLLHYCFPLQSASRACLPRDERKEPLWWTKLLLKHGVKLTRADVQGWRKPWAPGRHVPYGPAHIARIAFYYPELVPECVKLGADPNAPCRALSRDLQHDGAPRENCIFYCLSKIDSHKEFHHPYFGTSCREYGKEEREKREQQALAAITALVKAGANINAICGDAEHSFTPLTTALSKSLDDKRSYAFIEALLKLGACPNVKLLQGHTVLSRFISKFGMNSDRAHDIIPLLIRYKGDINASPQASLYAASESSGDLLKLLLKHGLRFDSYSALKHDHTPLAQAMAHANMTPFEKMQRVLWLLDLGVPADDGCALYTAACVGLTDIAGVLIARGCSPQSLVKPHTAFRFHYYLCIKKPQTVHKLFEEYVQEYDRELIGKKRWKRSIDEKVDDAYWQRDHEEFEHRVSRVRTLFENAKSYQNHVHELREVYNKAPRFTEKPDSCCACGTDYSSHEDLCDADKAVAKHVNSVYRNLRDSPWKACDAMKSLTGSVCTDPHLKCDVTKTRAYIIEELHDMPADVRMQAIEHIKAHPLADIFVRHARRYDECSDVLESIIKLPLLCKSNKCEQLCAPGLFEYVMQSKPASWAPSWRHLEAVIDSDTLGYNYLAELVSGQNVNAYGPQGKMPLHMVLTRKIINMQHVCALLQAGADSNLPDFSGGNTALHHVLLAGDFVFAGKNDRQELINLLMQYGADKNRCNMYGETPEDIMQRKK